MGAIAIVAEPYVSGRHRYRSSSSEESVYSGTGRTRPPRTPSERRRVNEKMRSGHVVSKTSYSESRASESRDRMIESPMSPGAPNSSAYSIPRDIKSSRRDIDMVIAESPYCNSEIPISPIKYSSSRNHHTSEDKSVSSRIVDIEPSSPSVDGEVWYVPSKDES